MRLMSGEGSPAVETNSRLDRESLSFDTIRCGFVEGPEAFEGSGIRYQSHIQIAVRNPACVVGVFRPRMNV
jgi:hypothetical protein